MEKMKKLSVIWGVIVISLFALLTTFGMMYKNKTKGYKELENKLAEAEKKYADAHFAYPETGIVKTDAHTLIKEGYLDHLKLNDSECTGYATVGHDSVAFEFKGYVKCENYTTKGYEK